MGRFLTDSDHKDRKMHKFVRVYNTLQHQKEFEGPATFQTVIITCEKVHLFKWPMNVRIREGGNCVCDTPCNITGTSVVPHYRKHNLMCL